MSAHTPGPWQKGFNAQTDQWTVVRETVRFNSSFNMVIAETREVADGHALANARLIAAAPRMLELLREAHSLISDHFSIDNPLARAIYDVIRRDVEGESKS